MLELVSQENRSESTRKLEKKVNYVEAEVKRFKIHLHHPTTLRIIPS
jgi:hypothetical protein